MYDEHGEFIWSAQDMADTLSREEIAAWLSDCVKRRAEIRKHLRHGYPAVEARGEAVYLADVDQEIAFLKRAIVLSDWATV